MPPSRHIRALPLALAAALAVGGGAILTHGARVAAQSPIQPAQPGQPGQSGQSGQPGQPASSADNAATANRPSSSNRAADATGRLSLTLVAPAVGSTVTTTRSIVRQISSTVTTAGAPPEPASELSLREEDTKRITILALDNDVPSKVKVTYLVAESRLSVSGRPPRRDQSELTGKTFVIVADKPVPGVLNDFGEPVSARLRELIQRDWADFGQRNVFTAAVPMRAVEISEEWPLDPDRLKRFLNLDSASRITLAKVKVLGQRVLDQVPCLALAVTIRSSTRVGQAETRFDLSGEVLLMLDGGGPLKLDLQGTLTQAGSSGGVTVEGKGSMTLGQTWVIQAPTPPGGFNPGPGDPIRENRPASSAMRPSDRTNSNSGSNSGSKSGSNSVAANSPR